MFGAAHVDPGRVAMYIRWSTEEQGSGTTLEVQRDACRHFMLSQGWRFCEDLIFVDDGYSGATLERPALGELRRAAREGRVSAVVVYKLDRLSRNLLDCVSLVRREWSGVALFSTTERFDTHSSMGQMVFNILVSFAEFERNVIRERTMSGKRKRREQARNSGFRYPYGYRRAEGGGFEIDPDKAQVVRRMFAEYVAGSGMHTIASQLNRDGIPAPSGGLWRQCTVSLMLQNPFYAGHYAAGYYRSQDGRQKRSKQPGFLKKHAVPAIISQSEFDRAQELRRRRFRAGFVPPRDSSYLLTGVLACSRCSGRMVGHNGNGSRRYYLCATARQFGNCASGSIPADEVEARVLAAIRERYAPERLLNYLSQAEALRQERVAAQQQRLVWLKQRLGEAKERRRKLDDDYLRGDLEGKQYTRLTERIEAAIAETDEQADRAQERLHEAATAAPDPVQIQEMLRRLDGVSELAPDQVRRLLRQLLARVRVFRAKTKGRYSTAPVELEIEHNDCAIVTA